MGGVKLEGKSVTLVSNSPAVRRGTVENRSPAGNIDVKAESITVQQTAAGSAVTSQAGEVILSGSTSVTLSNKDSQSLAPTVATYMPGSDADGGKNGVKYPSKDGKITIISPGKITITNEREGGIAVSAANGSGTVEVNADGSGSVTVKGEILADSADGDTNAVTLNLGSGGSLDGNTEAKGGGSTVTLTAGSGSTVTGDLAASDGATLAATIAGGTLTGKAAADGGTVDVSTAGGGTWNMTDTSTVRTLALGDGTVNFPKAEDSFTPKTLTVTGDFSGNGGTVALNTALGGDDSPTDRLEIGGNSSGTAKLAVTNAGGSGAQTTEGIEVVTVAGSSDATFTKASRITAGAYDYDLVKKGKNWYLTSSLTPEEPEEPENPDTPVTPVTPETPSEPAQPSEPSIVTNTVRPEAAAYTANMAASNTLFLMTLHDRLGNPQYAVDPSKNGGSAWVRVAGSHGRFEMADRQTVTRTDSGVGQAGGDIFREYRKDLGEFRLGLMAGYANSTSKTHQTRNGYSAKGHTTGYSTGLYGTWLGNPESELGPYADAWVSWQRFKNRVSGTELPKETYRSRGFVVSLEGGYGAELRGWTDSDGWTKSVRLSGEAQAVRFGVRAKRHVEANGTVVEGTGDGNIRTRLTAKLSLVADNAAKTKSAKPFLALSWLHDTKSFGVLMDGTADSMRGARNAAEVKIGAEGKLSPVFTLWGNVAQTLGSHGSRSTSALVGLKRLF